jgi:hypothetical protein
LIVLDAGLLVGIAADGFTGLLVVVVLLIVMVDGYIFCQRFVVNDICFFAKFLVDCFFFVRC